MPTRYLKPGIRDSEPIEGLSPMAEVLFYRLLVTVDDFGRYDARPAMIKSQCFPIKEDVSAKKCDELLRELSESGLVIVYTSEGKPVLQIAKWDNKPRATESKFPELSDGCMQVYADARGAFTNVPLTGTGTGTKTDNRKPETDASASPPEGVSPQTWADWLKLRKTKRAPVTQTVVNGAIGEAGKAGMSLEDFLQVWCRRGSQGLEAAWLRPDERSTAKQPQAKTFAERDREAGWARWEEQTGRIHPDRIKGQQNEFRETMGQVIDLTPKTLEIEQ